MPDRIKIICSVESIRYKKGDFHIAAVIIDKVKEGNPVTNNKRITIKGLTPELVVGNVYTLIADYVNDPKWGGQYKVVSMYGEIDFGKDNKDGQKQFLSNLFTPLQIKNMYNALPDPFETLKKGDKEQLLKVKGCGKETAERWIKKFNDNTYLARIFSELAGYDLTNNIVKKLLDTYKNPDTVIEKVKSDPYVLCYEVEGIGWKTADKIALESGVDRHSVKRIGAYIYKFLNDCGYNGFSWVKIDDLYKNICSDLDGSIPMDMVMNAISEMSDKFRLNDDKTEIGLLKFYSVAKLITHHLFRLKNAESDIKCENWENILTEIEQKNNWQFTPEQRQGIETVLKNNVTVIYGEAGTGKSSTVSAFLEILRNYSFVQCALSGRASSRMSEITGQEGYTIHRLLGFPSHDDDKNGFAFHDENPLKTDIVIVDELSMVDAFLFYYLIRAIPSGAKLVMLGDTGQLESIGCGNVLSDIINSGAIPAVHYTQIHRQAARSAIITESRKIRHGEQITAENQCVTEVRGELQDLQIDCYNGREKTFDKIINAFKAEIGKKNSDIMEIQILVPVKNTGAACTNKLNKAIQDIYNPPAGNKPQIKITAEKDSFFIRKGDKIINTCNCYYTKLPIYNGNIGIVKEVYPEDNAILADFAGIGEVYIDDNIIGNIRLGYAITVHKSQGSQFDCVIFGTDQWSYMLLTREMMYTGITRAKKKCYLIAENSALHNAVKTEGVSKKQTYLKDLLKDKNFLNTPQTTQ